MAGGVVGVVTTLAGDMMCLLTFAAGSAPSLPHKTTINPNQFGTNLFTLTVSTQNVFQYLNVDFSITDDDLVLFIMRKRAAKHALVLPPKPFTLLHLTSLEVGKCAPH